LHSKIVIVNVSAVPLDTLPLARSTVTFVVTDRTWRLNGTQEMKGYYELLICLLITYAYRKTNTNEGLGLYLGS